MSPPHDDTVETWAPLHIRSCARHWRRPHKTSLMKPLHLTDVKQLLIRVTSVSVYEREWENVCVWVSPPHTQTLLSSLWAIDGKFIRGSMTAAARSPLTDDGDGSVHAYMNSLPLGKRQGQAWWKLALGPLHYRNQGTMGCISAGSDEERLLFRITHGRMQGCLLMSLPPWRQAGLPPSALRPVITLEAAGSTLCSHRDGEEEAIERSHAAVWKWRLLPLAMFPFKQKCPKTKYTAIKKIVMETLKILKKSRLKGSDALMRWFFKRVNIKVCYNSVTEILFLYFCFQQTWRRRVSSLQVNTMHYVSDGICTYK